MSSLRFSHGSAQNILFLKPNFVWQKSTKMAEAPFYTKDAEKDTNINEDEKFQLI